MLAKLAGFIQDRAKVVLAVAVLGAVVAGVFGAGVSKHLSPYGANDPSTQSVRVTNAFQAATGRQIDPGVVALVTPRAAGGVRSASGRAAVTKVAAQLSTQPGVTLVRTAFQTHDPAMISRDGGSTYIVGYFRARSDKRIADDAQKIEDNFAGNPEVRLGGLAIAQAQVNRQVSADLSHAELLAFPFIFVLSLLFFRSGVAATCPCSR
jgi:RND superfamily putative drug exporter